MGISFVSTEERMQQDTVAATDTAVSEQKLNLKIVTPETYSVIDTKKDLEYQLANSDEIDKLVSTIDVNDTNTIVTFGNDMATQISKASDQVLRSVNMEQIDESSELLNALAKIMEQFDAKDLKDEKPGLFANLRKQLDKILAKYHTMGDEVDKIYVELCKYETEIGVASRNLQTMYDANIQYYKDLLKYIMAGEQACKELDVYIEDYKAKVADNPESGTIAMDLQTLEQTRSILEQRVMDLKISENVAMQTVPMLKSMEFSNANLLRKINSAFIITLPVFKQSLAQAIMLKRQRVQAESMKALDDKTNELLLKNAQNTVAQTKMTAKMANGNSIQIETLEKTWQTIVDGIEETKQLQQEARKRRVDDARRLQALKDDYRSKINA